MEHQGIKVGKEGDFFFTIGLKDHIGRELRVSANKSPDEEYFKLILYLIDYVYQTKLILKPNETIAYRSWILQFVEAGENYYEIWEAERSGNGYRAGSDYAIATINEQKDECSR